METKMSSPYTVTVRRNPPRKARPTPSSAVPTSSLLRSPPPRTISSFPIDDILSIEIPEKQQTTEPPPPPSSSENLKVFLRIRPLIPQLKKEKTVAEMNRSKNAWPKNIKSTNALPRKVKKSNEVCVTVNDEHSVTISPPLSLQDGKRIKSEVYEGFSQVFSLEASQSQVYEKMVNPLVEDFLKGKSGMLAALGPSGSGKTHTIFGCGRDPGMVPLALRRILSHDKGEKMRSRRIFYLSMFEISSEKGKSEKIFDLSQDGVDSCIQQSSIKGVREAALYDAQQAESLIACGLLKRATAMTNSNSQSSRSQCIINIRCEYKKVDGEVGDNSNSAVLTIVDLAGAEREKKTGNQGVRLLESNFINNTSMVFGLCLRSLLEHQKNRRKPMQKHFQNSLLTRYLRDYLEGKKRMALLLTVRPGEEDYLDTSFVLRQASPYTKIKFDIIEEHGTINHNKRPVQTTPTVVQLKRTKLNQSESREINQGSDDCPQLLNEEAAVKGVKDGKLTDILVQSEAIITIEANKRNSLKVDHIGLERKERNHEIMQNFGKALWKVLKEYKTKLEVAENEIGTLRDCLTSEKTRSADLENQLRDWQSNCCCRKEVSSEVSSREVDESRGKGSLECEEHQSTDYNEVAENETCTPRDSITTENLGCSELDNELRDWQSNSCYTKGVVSEVSSREVDESRGTDSLDCEDHQSTDRNEVAENETCTPRDSITNENLGCSELENELRDWQSNRCCTKGVASKVSSREVDESRGTNSLDCGKHQSTDHNEVAENETCTPRDSITNKQTRCFELENELKDCRSNSFCRKGVASEVSSREVDECRRKSSSALEDHQFTDCSEVKSAMYSCHLEGSLHMRNEKRLDSTTAQPIKSSIDDAIGIEDLENPNEIKEDSTHLDGKANVLLSGSRTCTDQEYEQEEESSVCTSQAISSNRDKNSWLEEEHELIDSVLPECKVNSFDTSLFVENISSFPAGDDPTQNEEDKYVLGRSFRDFSSAPFIHEKKPLSPPTMLISEQVVQSVGRRDNTPEAVSKHGCCTKLHNANKPKRRLQPASSILLKDIGIIEFKDENEKPKGVKAVKKGVPGGNRTQGSISLLRLLKDNLAI